MRVGRLKAGATCMLQPGIMPSCIHTRGVPDWLGATTGTGNAAARVPQRAADAGVCSTQAEQRRREHANGAAGALLTRLCGPAHAGAVAAGGPADRTADAGDSPSVGPGVRMRTRMHAALLASRPLSQSSAPRSVFLADRLYAHTSSVLRALSAAAPLRGCLRGW